jgi:Outer membrane protein beta-barrel domain
MRLYCMSLKQPILLALLTFSIGSYGQNSKWQISLQVQPEITFHQDSYPWWKEGNNKTTLNVGIASAIQYNINSRFFVNAGVGFISRTLETANFLNQAALPPPKQGFTQELVTTYSVSYRVLSFPVNIGYNFLKKEKFNSFVTTGFAPNYLLNTEYKSNFSRYDGAYKKNYWQGYSIYLGIGIDYTLGKTLSATAALSYSIIHQVREDEYLLNQNGRGLTLGHNFLSLSLGAKIAL